MKLTDIEIPPEVAERFVEDMRAFFEETNTLRADGIAAANCMRFGSTTVASFASPT